MKRICTECKQEKELSEFYGPKRQCKRCQIAKLTLWQKANAYIIRVRRIKREYGLSEEDFDTLKEKQNNKCMICIEVKPLQVDHDHSTGKVRGLLCSMCNKGLGLFRDNPDNLDRASSYLRSN